MGYEMGPIERLTSDLGISETTLKSELCSLVSTSEKAVTLLRECTPRMAWVILTSVARAYLTPLPPDSKRTAIVVACMLEVAIQLGPARCPRLHEMGVSNPDLLLS